jgi:hypothetical protein
VSSLGSEALQIKINANVTATIGDTNVELWFSYSKDDVDYIFYIKMTNWNPVGSGILLVHIGIPISTSRNWNSDLYWI